MRAPNRPIKPVGPVQAYKTYSLSAPIETHRRRATCREIDCPQWIEGWETPVIPGSTDEALLRRMCDGLIDGVRRYFTELPIRSDGMLRLHFAAGQPCLAASTHTVTLEREPLYVVRGGDWRSSTGLIRRHTRGNDWVEDFAEHQIYVAGWQERG